ncbi:hypothetical protein ASD64_01255 [Mesorhizobium sp. Root157]|uniref:hypothetical protein n=1 Tax=Mesorhizobium sp. Root157 TaxID=1736477 RepID=UPI0006F3D9FF|nr:hypothetical protein [Mesorhizobium sp. Root157]KRA00230.1 hypothetical protein ASD64_01255 [Mesorhizobium sp. Root157]
MAGQLEYSGTAVSNTAINSIPIQGSSSVKYGNDAIQQLMADQANAITKVADKTGTYTAVKGDYNQLIRATGALTLNLTAAATLTAGWCVWVKADGGAVTVDPAGAELINGAATLSLPDGFSAFIVCTGSAFRAMVFGNGDVTLTGTQTLTNKTLTAPVMTSPVVSGASATLAVGDATTTGNVSIELGINRSGDGLSLIDFHAQEATDYEARIMRGSGANGAWQFIQNGTGITSFNTAVRLGADGSNALDAVTKQQMDTALASKAGFYTGSTQDETNLPVGSYIAILGPASYEKPRNSTQTINIDSASANRYVLGGAGAAMSGTWKASGSTGFSNSPSAAGGLYRRTA